MELCILSIVFCEYPKTARTLTSESTIQNNYLIFTCGLLSIIFDSQKSLYIHHHIFYFSNKYGRLSSASEISSIFWKEKCLMFWRDVVHIRRKRLAVQSCSNKGTPALDVRRRGSYTFGTLHFLTNVMRLRSIFTLLFLFLSVLFFCIHFRCLRFFFYSSYLIILSCSWILLPLFTPSFFPRLHRRMFGY